MWIRLRSDAQLANRVVANGAAAASPVAGLSRLLAGEGTPRAPYKLKSSPLGLLLAAGRATAAVGPTPLARFNTVGWWAVLRWYWTLDVTASGRMNVSSGTLDVDASGRVNLSSDSAQIQNHHRSAFSEALGLAVSLLLAEYLLAGGTPATPPGAASRTSFAPVVVDVDSLLPSSSSRPDLLVLDRPLLNGMPPPASILLEAKGRTPSGTIAKELANGTHQVLAIDGDTRRIVAGVEVPRTSLSAFAIEVDPMGPHTPLSIGARGSGPTAVPVGLTGSSEQPRTREDSEALSAAHKWVLASVTPEAIAGADAARLRAFAGLEDTTIVKRGAQQLAPDVKVELEGVTFRINNDDNSVEITVGLLAEIAEELRTGGHDPSRFERSRAVVHDIRAALPAEDPSASIQGVLARDGCAIAVRRL
jgi:hypothetical protein